MPFTAVCIMIDRSQKLVECDFPSPPTGFDGFEEGADDDCVNRDELVPTQQ